MREEQVMADVISKVGGELEQPQLESDLEEAEGLIAELVERMPTSATFTR